MSTVLIIEDHTKISNQIQLTIDSLGKNIKIFKSKEGKKALKIAENIFIDIFIIDIVLPDWDGIELAKVIRKAYPYQPIIIESSKSDSQYQTVVHDQISNIAFLKKPFTRDKLIDKINQAIGIAETLGGNHLKIKQHGFSRHIEFNDILYIEKVKGKNMIEIILYNRYKNSLSTEQFVGISLNALLDMLEGKKFLVRCHKGFIINPKMIEKLNYANNTISLKHTEYEIPIGKTYKNTIDLFL